MKHARCLTAAVAMIASMLVAGQVQAQLPNPGVMIDAHHTALVVTDPQNDFLSPDGVTWGLVGESVTANGTVEHIEQLLATAKQAGLPVFVSPHYYYPSDHGWQFGGAVETMMHAINMFDRQGRIQVAVRCSASCSTVARESVGAPPVANATAPRAALVVSISVWKKTTARASTAVLRCASGDSRPRRYARPWAAPQP